MQGAVSASVRQRAEYRTPKKFRHNVAGGAPRYKALRKSNKLCNKCGSQADRVEGGPGSRCTTCNLEYRPEHEIARSA